MIIAPSFFETEGRTEKHYDLFSRLLKDRIVLLFNEVNDDLAATVIAQLLYLESLDPDADIQIYRDIFHRDMFKDIQKLAQTQDVEILSDICYAMAKHANSDILEYDEWLDQFGMMDMLDVIDEVTDLWMTNNSMLNVEKNQEGQ